MDIYIGFDFSCRGPGEHLYPTFSFNFKEIIETQYGLDDPYLEDTGEKAKILSKELRELADRLEGKSDTPA